MLYLFTFSLHPAVTEPSEAGRKGKTNIGKNKFFQENFQIFWKIKNDGQRRHFQSLTNLQPFFDGAFWISESLFFTQLPGSVYASLPKA